MSRSAKLAVLLLLAASLAWATLVKQPYLQTLINTTVIVHWETSASQAGQVEYGLTSSYGMVVSDTDPTVNHELTLTGLKADTLYHYRAISGSDTSADATFHSNVSENHPFRFFVYGDNRSDSAAHQSVVDRMLLAAPRPGLALDVGDLTVDGSTAAFQTFFNIEHELMGRLPMYPSVGNHDVRDMTNWLRFFALPHNERWYTVRYGNSVFHAIDVYSSFLPESPQYDWLVSELQADSANPAIRHIFVWFHEPPFTTNAGDSSNLTVRQHLCPLFERFHVAIAFQGHVHCYEHSLVNDVHYIISGGGGAPLYNTWDSPQSWTVYREATLEDVVVDVNGDTLRSVGVRPDGTEFDTLVLVQRSAVVELPPSTATDRMQATPNPFASQVCLTLETKAPGPARVEVCDALGRTVHVLTDENPAYQRHTLVWDASDSPAGLYFCIARMASSTAVTALIHTR
jgi:acid phosphatase type 7